MEHARQGTEACREGMEKRREITTMQPTITTSRVRRTSSDGRALTIRILFGHGQTVVNQWVSRVFLFFS